MSSAQITAASTAVVVDWLIAGMDSIVDMVQIFRATTT
jgi:hypothetical protein